jgi:hypothetical protein
LLQESAASKAIETISRWVDRVRALEQGLQAKKQFEVFLGGSCNPTTWRRDSAIPFCLRHSITFYNPQVETWTPELVEIEALAKDDADFLLFVVDGQTRAISSMLECCEYICSGRAVILCIEDVAVQANDECDSSKMELDVGQVKDLNRGRAYVADIAKRHGTPVFSTVQDALLELKRLVDARNMYNWKLDEGLEFSE